MEIKHLNFNPFNCDENIYNYYCNFGEAKEWYSDFSGTPNYERVYPEWEIITISFEEKKYTFAFRVNEFLLFNKNVSNGLIKDEKGNVLNLKTIIKYIISYAKGFEKGYTEFISNFKHTDFFEVTNRDKAYYIFERVHFGLNQRTGNFLSYKSDSQNSNEVSRYITEEFFFETGYEGGEFYKAWELIFEKPVLFKDFFDGIKLPLIKKSKEPIRFWNSNETDSIKKFRELLLINDFIDEIEEEIFISHFTGTFTKKTKKINWKDNQDIFISLFDNIEFAINKNYKTKKDKTIKSIELIKHFTIKNELKKNTDLTKTRSELKNNYNNKTIKYIVIEQIKNELKKYFIDSY